MRDEPKGMLNITFESCWLNSAFQFLNRMRYVIFYVVQLLNACIHISTSTGIPIELQSEEFLMMHVGIESEILDSLQLQIQNITAK